MNPSKAFILGAGFGKRLRPITDERPKPMAEVNGTCLIDSTIDQLKTENIKEIVVNTHYRGAQLAEHLKKRTDVQIHISYEEKILNTGGGIKNALSYFNSEDFFILSGDSLWTNGPDKTALKQLSDMWDPNQMDILMLLQPVANMSLTSGIGDYDIDNEGRAMRAKDQSGAHMFTSIRINRAHIFDDAPNSAFSYLELMDKAQENGRLYGLVHDASWYHISTPKDLKSVNMALKGTI